MAARRPSREAAGRLFEANALQQLSEAGVTAQGIQQGVIARVHQP